jgi:hypothetical protein
VRVSDEDIDALWFDMGPGQSETLGEIVTELRALRRVADLAAAYLTDGSRHAELVDALEAAQRPAPDTE